jgi:hypothetical protein
VLGLQLTVLCLFGVMISGKARISIINNFLHDVFFVSKLLKKRGRLERLGVQGKSRHMLLNKKIYEKQGQLYVSYLTTNGHQFSSGAQ